jgi:hypothetical protein
MKTWVDAWLHTLLAAVHVKATGRHAAPMDLLDNCAAMQIEAAAI